MFDFVSPLAGALVKLFGEPAAKKIVRWTKGTEAAQLVKLLKQEHPAAKSMLTQPEALGALWLYAETGVFRREEMVRAVRPLTKTDEEAEALAEAIRTTQWRVMRDERRTHFELLRLADELRDDRQAGEDRILARIEEALSGLTKALPAARQLPAQTLPFVDRKKEMVAAEEMLQAPAAAHAAVVVNCSGMMGCGKSALVLELAHREAERFPAGVLFVEMRTADGSAREPADIAARLLRDLGVSPQAIPQEPEARLATLRSTAAETPVMLVLDDAVSEKQVRDLIPADTSSLVLITSRAPLAIGGANLIDLAELADEDATELLESIVGKRVGEEPDAAAAIVARCAGLPLALVVVAGRALRQPMMPLSAFVPARKEPADVLAELDDPDGTLHGALSLAIDAASAAPRRLFLLLAALEVTDISPSLVAALMQTDTGRATRLIEELGEERLLIAVEGGRWKIHNLLRAMARSLAHQELPEEEIASARKRRVDWLVEGADERVRDLEGEV